MKLQVTKISTGEKLQGVFTDLGLKDSFYESRLDVDEKFFVARTAHQEIKDNIRLRAFSEYSQFKEHGYLVKQLKALCDDNGK